MIITCPSPDSVFSSFSFDGTNRHKELVERLVDSSSIRLCAIHACVPDTFLFRMLRPFIVGAMGPSVRPRLKFTTGESGQLNGTNSCNCGCFDSQTLTTSLIVPATGIHRRYTFKGYGIPTDIIPITDTGNIKTIFLRQWIKLRTLLESGHGPKSIDTHDSNNSSYNKNFPSPTIVEFPGSRDVLYRTGTTTSCHRGNSAFRELIESKLEEYSANLHVSIPILADELIHEVVWIRKGRFLKWDNRGYWTVMNDQGQTNTKVTASIRDFKRWKDSKKNMQSLDSSTHIFEGQDLKRRKMLSDDKGGFVDDAAPAGATGAEERSLCFDL